MSQQPVTVAINAAKGRWPHILPALGITIPANGKHGPCPKCGGTDRFRFDDRDGRGTWICSHCQHGDGLDLVKLVAGIDAASAAKEVAQALALPAVQQSPLLPARKEASDAQKLAKVQKSYQALLSRSSTGESPYLTDKGLQGQTVTLIGQTATYGGVEFPVGALLLPLMDVSGQLRGAQLIHSLGEKRLLPHSLLAGAFIAVNEPGEEPPEQVIITEGYATALTVARLTEGVIVAAVAASNLIHVAQQLRQKWPEARLIVAGDNDFDDGKENTGKLWAEKAAKAVDGWVTLPPTRHKADWDDFRQDQGLERAKEAFREEMILFGKGKTKLPQGFRLTQEYLWYDKLVNKSDGDTEIRNIKICSPLRVTAITCDEDGSNYGRLLEWEDTNGISRKWAMPMEMLCGGGEELRRVLLVNGLSYININGQARAHLMEYISLCKPERKVTCVTKTGWHGSVYVLQDEVIGIGAESVILQTSSVQGRDFRQSGTLEEWREQIGRYCVGNGRVAFAVSLAFAAPLLKLVGVGGGGYHLKGESTDGKTTTMKVAASVCGGTDFWHTWRATGNALEGTASRRNDATLMLDEIREVDGREAGNIAYMLANGQGKARARTDGSVRETNRWCLLFLSTGELSLVEHAANVGERTYAGVEVRMIQIPSDTGKYGVFEELHGFAGGKALAEHLEQAVTTSHGAPFREWLRCLTADLPGMTHKAKAMLKEYTRLLTPENAGNQVGRAVTRFALVAMAGELATEAGITGWAQGEALNAAKSCLAAWMYDRGHTANQEDAAALEQVREFMTRNQFSRFADWFDAHSRPGNMVGFRQVKKGDNLEEAVTTFYVLPSGWKEISKGFDAKKVARLCATAGYLDVPEDETRTQKNIRLPEMGLKRVYQFNSSVLG
jgi:putative DNA primase/helicase